MSSEELAQVDYQLGVWRKLELEALAEVGLSDLVATDEAVPSEEPPA